MTAFPYWGILLVIVVNTLIVMRMDVSVDVPDAEGSGADEA